jgi:hypothetical protein
VRLEQMVFPLVPCVKISEAKGKRFSSSLVQDEPPYTQIV